MRMQNTWRGGVRFGLIFSLLLAGCSGGGSSPPEAVTTPAPASGTVGWNEVEGLHGLWSGTSSNGRTMWGAVVDNRYYFWYSEVGNPTVLRGGVTGTIEFNAALKNNHLIESTDTVDFSMDDRRVYEGALTGSFTPKSIITGTMVLPNVAAVQFSLLYQPDSGTKPGDPGPIGVADMADIIGTYQGPTEWNNGLTPALITVAADGLFTVTGYWDGLANVGWQTTPCPTMNGHIFRQYWGARAYQFDATIGCLFPAREVRGASVLDPVTNRLFIFAVRENPSPPGPERFQALIRGITKQP